MDVQVVVVDIVASLRYIFIIGGPRMMLLERVKRRNAKL